SRSYYRPVASTRADEFVRAAARPQRVQRRSRRGDLEPVRLCSHQADHVAQATAKKRTRAERRIRRFDRARRCPAASDCAVLADPPLQIRIKSGSFFLLSCSYLRSPAELF